MRPQFSIISKSRHERDQKSGYSLKKSEGVVKINTPTPHPAPRAPNLLEDDDQLFCLSAGEKEGKITIRDRWRAGYCKNLSKGSVWALGCGSCPGPAPGQITEPHNGAGWKGPLEIVVVSGSGGFARCPVNKMVLFSDPDNSNNPLTNSNCVLQSAVHKRPGPPSTRWVLVDVDGPGGSRAVNTGGHERASCTPWRERSWQGGSDRVPGWRAAQHRDRPVRAGSSARGTRFQQRTLTSAQNRCPPPADRTGPAPPLWRHCGVAPAPFLCRGTNPDVSARWRLGRPRCPAALPSSALIRPLPPSSCAASWQDWSGQRQPFSCACSPPRRTLGLTGTLCPGSHVSSRSCHQWASGLPGSPARSGGGALLWVTSRAEDAGAPLARARRPRAGILKGDGPRAAPGGPMASTSSPLVSPGEGPPQPAAGRGPRRDGSG